MCFVTEYVCGDVRLDKNKGVTWDPMGLTKKSTFSQSGPFFAKVFLRNEVGDIRFKRKLEGNANYCLPRILERNCWPQNAFGKCDLQNIPGTIVWSGHPRKRWGHTWQGDKVWLYIDIGCRAAEFQVCSGGMSRVIN